MISRKPRPPMQSSPIAAVSDVLNSHVLNTATELAATTECDRRELAETLAAVPDPRRRRGVRHPFTPLLAAVTCAMLAGSRSFVAIAEWIADLPAAARTDLGLTGPIPAASTLWRLLTAVDPTALQDAVGTWLRARLTEPPVQGADRRRRPGRRVLAVDGKAMRATLRGANPVHLLAVLDHATSIVLAQVNVDAKTNEIPCLKTVLNQITDLKDVLITADALHCQTAHITYLLGRGAHLLVCAKGNQPGLLKRLKSLPWKQIPVGHTSTTRAHGRIEERTLKVVTVADSAGGLGFPGAAQAIQITRRTKRITPKPGKKNTWRTETVYAIVTLPAEQASPAELATWTRSHWFIENRLHWVRDVTLGEDLHQARTGNGPHVLAILRNVVISVLRLAGHDNIARALRHYGRHTDQVIRLLTRPFTTSQ
jgi:predicted transposase YbfD/YdcC